MRGKLTILVLLIGSAAFTAFAYWYFFSTSPTDSRFNQLRSKVPTTIALVAPKIGDFRLEGEPGGTSGRYFDIGESFVSFSAVNVGDHTKAVDGLNAPINGCDKLTMHADAKIPYVYADCPDNHAFAWVNGTHRFEAQSADVGMLVSFVNTYLY